jgi:hypothetical protein
MTASAMIAIAIGAETPREENQWNMVLELARSERAWKPPSWRPARVIERPVSTRGRDTRPALPPDAALEELLAGNRRFAANRLTSIEHDLAILKEHTVDKQEPFAAVLACADSRVPVELIFDQSIGHIFVTRIAGNIVTFAMRQRRARSAWLPRSTISPRGR